jgi:NarL family two-component system response regulator YdfI
MAKRILMVDDSMVIRRLVRSYFAKYSDFEVCGELEDGEDAVKAAPELKPDVIVLDLSLPRLSGLEVAQALKPILPTTPTILFTAHNDVVTEQLARSMGIDSVLSKSDGMEVLMAEIQRLLAVTYTVGSKSMPEPVSRSSH